MRVWKALQNPVALALQGFVAGALLLLAANPLGGGEAAQPQTEAESILAGIDA